MPRRRFRGGPDDLFDGLPLAPPGRPELICRFCGGPRIPRQRCGICFSNPKTKNEVARIKIESFRKKKIQACKDRWARINEAASIRRKLQRRRMAQVAELDRLLSKIFGCFERDRGGDWQLYADRLAEIQEALNETEVLLPVIRKLRPYTSY